MNENPMIVICDDERTYACHLLDYLESTRAVDYPICIYTDSAQLVEDVSPKKAPLIVIAESEYTEAVAGRGYAKVLVLNETDRMMDPSVANISKYQETGHIAAVIQELLAEDGAEAPQTIRHSGPMKILGFHTPVSRCLQTTFALTLGELLAEQHRVLYMNFENWPELDSRLENVPQGSVADLLYYNDCAKDKVSPHLAGSITSVGGLDVILPLEDFMELQGVKAEAWLSLFQTIEQVSEYEYLLLDLSESVQGLLQILETCDEIFTIRRGDNLSLSRLDGYLNFLKAHHEEELAAKTRYWEFPIFPELPARVEDYRQGALADEIRDRLSGREDRADA
jgi:hypothetical protein